MNSPFRFRLLRTIFESMENKTETKFYLTAKRESEKIKIPTAVSRRQSPMLRDLDSYQVHTSLKDYHYGRMA